MKLRLIVPILIASVSFIYALPAFANCSISNETKYSFTVESGNTSNQRIGAHTTTSIAAGKILGKSDEGKTVGGFCKDGDHSLINEENGVVFIAPK